MMLLAVFVVACAVVLCLALAASSSPVYGFNAQAELASKLDALEPPRSARAVSAGEVRPIISAAGMQ